MLLLPWLKVSSDYGRSVEEVNTVDYRSLSNVLAILRLIKTHGEAESGIALIRKWAAGTNVVVSETAIIRTAGYIIEQVEEAKTVIHQSQLADEAKHGVQESLDGLASAFSLAGMHSASNSHIRNLSGAIANFVILLSASGVETQPQPPEEAIDLAKEVEDLMPEFDSPDLDPVVRELAKRHLQILATMLRHVPVFGLEAALATYFELVLKVRRADANTGEKQKKAVEPLMDKINGWQQKLAALDKAWNQGARWLTRGKSGLALLGFIDPSSAA